MENVGRNTTPPVYSSNYAGQSMPTARLLDFSAAREYLGGVDPHKVTPPIRLGCRLRWDRKKLAAELDRMSGVSAPANKAGSALEAWEQSRDED